LSWGKCINKVTRSKVTGRYKACELVWKTFRMAECPFEWAVVRDGEEAEVEKFKSSESDGKRNLRPTIETRGNTLGKFLLRD
jgi:hypothetical protein